MILGDVCLSLNGQVFNAPLRQIAGASLGMTELDSGFRRNDDEMTNEPQSTGRRLVRGFLV